MDAHEHRKPSLALLYLGRPSVKRTSPLPLPFFLLPAELAAPSNSAGGVVADVAKGGVVDPLLDPDAQASWAGVLPSPVTRFSISCRWLGFSKSARRSAAVLAPVAGSEGNEARLTGLAAFGAVRPPADEVEEA